ncbi:MAG: acylphosphatase [Elusimicrobia bacterium]|nr:acylphosphatase [Elusimicrobiota bacterium]
MKGKLERVRAVVCGRVQGVGFRWFVRDAAARLGLAGWVRNLPDGSVELEAEGPDDVIERFKEIVGNGNAQARVDRMESSRIDPRGGPRRFDIVA